MTGIDPDRTKRSNMSLWSLQKLKRKKVFIVTTLNLCIIYFIFIIYFFALICPRNTDEIAKSGRFYIDSFYYKCALFLLKQIKNGMNEKHLKFIKLNATLFKTK